MLCGHTACPKMCLDAARPVITRYGGLLPHSRCEIACCYGTLWLITVFTKSPESSTRSLALFLFIPLFVSSSSLVQSSAQLFYQYPACYAIRIPLPCTQEQRSCPEAGFAGSHLPMLFVVISVSIIAFHGRSCISRGTFFSIKIFYVFLMSHVLHVLPLVVPVTCSLSPYSRKQPSHQSMGDLIQHIWRVRRIDTDDTSSQKSVDLSVRQRAVYASY